MTKEKLSPFGIIIIGVLAFIISGCASGKSAGENKQAKVQRPDEPTAPEKTAEPPKPKYDFTEDLVAYYPFNGNANDESGNGNIGEVKGAALAADRHGEDGKAYSFDGQDDYILVPDSDSLDFGTGVDGWTISCWVNHRGPNRTKRLGGLIIAKHNRDGSPGVDYNLYRMRGKSGTIYRMGISTSNGRNGGWAVSPLPEGMNDEGWCHIVTTVEMTGKIKHLFINGKKFYSLKFERKNPAHDGGLRIGRGFHGSGRGLWNGLIDDVRIYNRALSEEQVKTLYDLEKPKE